MSKPLIVSAIESLYAADISLELTPAAEDADVVNIAGALSEAGAKRLHVKAFEFPAAQGPLDALAAAALTLDIGTDGTLVSPAAGPEILFDTEDDGTFDLDATDVVGGASLNGILVFRLGGANGRVLGIIGVITDGS